MRAEAGTSRVDRRHVVLRKAPVATTARRCIEALDLPRHLVPSPPASKDVQCGFQTPRIPLEARRADVQGAIHGCAVDRSPAACRGPSASTSRPPEPPKRALRRDVHRPRKTANRFLLPRTLCARVNSTCRRAMCQAAGAVDEIPRAFGREGGGRPDLVPPRCAHNGRAWTSFRIQEVPRPARVVQGRPERRRARPRRIARPRRPDTRRSARTGPVLRLPPASHARDSLRAGPQRLHLPPSRFRRRSQARTSVLQSAARRVARPSHVWPCFGSCVSDPALSPDRYLSDFYRDLRRGIDGLGDRAGFGSVFSGSIGARFPIERDEESGSKGETCRMKGTVPRGALEEV